MTMRGTSEARRDEGAGPRSAIDWRRELVEYAWGNRRVVVRARHPDDAALQTVSSGHVVGVSIAGHVALLLDAGGRVAHVPITSIVDVRELARPVPDGASLDEEGASPR
jgi:hypothetical protein